MAKMFEDFEHISNRVPLFNHYRVIIYICLIAYLPE